MTYKYASLLISTVLVLSTSIKVHADQTALTNQQILVKDGEVTITQNEFLLMIQDMKIAQRHLALSSPSKLQKILYDALVLKKKALGAKNKSLDQDNLIKWKIQNSTNNILSRALVNNFKDNLPPPADLESLALEKYNAHPEKFINKGTIKVAHILLLNKPTDSVESKDERKKLLKSIRLKITQGKLDFKSAVETYSDDKGSADKGGVIEHFSKGMTVKNFETAAFNLKKVGDLSDIIETKFGYHLIKLLERKEQTTIPFTKLKNTLIEEQKSRYVKTKVSEFLKSFDIGKDTVLFLPAIEKATDEASKNLLPRVKQ